MSRGQNKVSNRQMQDLRDAFNLFDRDGSGTISSSELHHVLVALNFKPTSSLLRKIMEEMDMNRNGTIEFNEFVKVMGKVYDRRYTNDEMLRAFQCFDTDGSGYITADELREVLQRLNPTISNERIVAALNQIDVNQDGKISFDEFIQMFQEI